jgi:hypothetical protein
LVAVAAKVAALLPILNVNVGLFPAVRRAVLSVSLAVFKAAAVTAVPVEVAGHVLAADAVTVTIWSAQRGTIALPWQNCNTGLYLLFLVAVAVPQRGNIAFLVETDVGPQNWVRGSNPVHAFPAASGVPAPLVSHFA